MPVTRTLVSGPATVFEPDATYDHYGFPCWVECDNGDLYMIVGQATAHSAAMGLVGKRCLSGDDPGLTASWGSLEVLSMNHATLSDRPAGAMRKLASGRVVYAWQRANDIWTSPGRQQISHCSYSDDNCETWSSPVVIPTMHWSTENCPGDLIELTPGGDVLCVTYGTPINDINGQWDVGLSISHDGCETWDSYAMALNDGEVWSEPQLAFRSDGSLLMTVAEVSGGTQPQYVSVASSPFTSWSTPSQVISNSINRQSLVRSPDGDHLLAGGVGGATQRLYTSWNDGASFPSYINLPTTPSPYYGPTWATPEVLGSGGESPNVGVAYSCESSGQASAATYFATYSSALEASAEGYGNTVSAGYGSATAEANPGSILVLPESSAWEQVGTSVFVRTVNEPCSVLATVSGTAGGLVRFRGTDADLFDMSLDGVTWASAVDVPAGTSIVHLRVTPEAPDTTLSAEIGVPV